MQFLEYACFKPFCSARREILIFFVDSSDRFGQLPQGENIHFCPIQNYNCNNVDEILIKIGE